MQLTLAEYTSAYNCLLAKYADAQLDRMNQKVWALPAPAAHARKHNRLLWLFTFALSSWEHSDTAYNYLTESQVQDIIAKTATLNG